MKINYDRLILSLDDKELELFVRDWVQVKAATYYEYTTFTGAGDLGRDVVGFITKDRHEGLWHNYQCKQYTRKLPIETAILEIGKILYYAYMNEFTVPDKYYFVVPNGMIRSLETLVFNPTQFKKTLIDEWDKYCGKKIIKGKYIDLSPELKKVIEDYEFANISRITVQDLLNDEHIKPVLFKWFGHDPGPAPAGITPIEVQAEELPYIEQLISAYNQRESCLLQTPEEVATYPEHYSHMQRQRERFYNADAFKKYYRDNTNPETIKLFENEIYFGIVEKYNCAHNDALCKINEVISLAGTLQPTSLLGKHASIPVKQGICHHYANENIIKWQF